MAGAGGSGILQKILIEIYSSVTILCMVKLHASIVDFYIYPGSV